jgi:hypothetical protein
MGSNEQPETPMKISDILRGALKLISGRGRWIKVDYRRVTEAGVCYCLAGAISAAAGRNQFSSPRKEECKPLGFRSDRTLIRWNDKPKRLKSEVIARLKAGIKRAVAAERAA